MGAELIISGGGPRNLETGEQTDFRANYESAEAALHQAAHNELLTPNIDQTIEEDGEVVYRKTAIREASKRLARERKINGFGTTDAHDPSVELEALHEKEG